MTNRTQHTPKPHEAFFLDLLAKETGIRADVFEKGHAAHEQFVAQSKQVVFDGMRFDCPPGVYKPRIGSSTEFFLRCMQSEIQVARAIEHNLPMIELGTGCGLIACALAKAGANNLVATDVYEPAVLAAQSNLAMNGVHNVSVHQSDLFSAFDSTVQFDVVMFNLPFSMVKATEGEPVCLSDPGGAVFNRFLAQLKSRLRASGCAYIAFSNISDTNLLRQQTGFKVELAQLQYFAESGMYRTVLKLTHQD